MSDFTINLDDQPADHSDITVGAVAPAPSEIDVVTVSADEPTLLAQLRNTLSAKVVRADVFIEVRERPGLSVRFSPTISQHQLKQWRKNSGEDRKGGMDSLRFASHVIANTCSGFFMGGQEITSNGESVGFNDDVIMKMVDATKVFDCVKAVYVLDPHIENAALTILDAAGFNDDLEQVDPTKAS